MRLRTAVATTQFRAACAFHAVRLGQSHLTGMAAVVALHLKLLWGAWRSWDLPLWDGAIYFQYGRLVATSFRFPPASWAPAYTAYYGLFQLLSGSAGPIQIYVAHRLATFLLVALLLYLLLRTLSSPLSAWLTAFYVAVLPGGFINHYVVHFFVLVPLLELTADPTLPGGRRVATLRLGPEALGGVRPFAPALRPKAAAGPPRDSIR